MLSRLVVALFLFASPVFADTNFPGNTDNIGVFGTAVHGQPVAHTTINNLRDAIIALEAKMGKDGATDTTTLDYILKSTSSIDPGHLHTGASLSAINASTITTGTLPNARLSTDVPFKNVLNTFSVLQTFGAGITVTGTATATTFSGSGASLTNIPETAITDGALLARVAANETITGTWTFSSAPTLSGVNITNIPESAITDGALLARVGANETITGNWSFTGNIASIRGQSLTWPAANAVGFLANNGSGILSWSTLFTGLIHDKGGQVFNVVAYGATGDGVTPDTTAINAAAADACASADGGTLLFPPGVYVQRADLVGCSNLKVRGEGGATLYWDTFGVGQTHYMLKLAGVSNVEVSGLTFLQTNTTAAFDTNKQQEKPIGVLNSTNVSIHDCTFENLYGNGGVYMGTNGSDSQHSDGNHVYGNNFIRCAVYGAVVVSGINNGVDHNYFEDCAAGVESDNSTQVIARNIFDSNKFVRVLKSDDDAQAVIIGISGRDSDDVGNMAVNNTMDGGRIALSNPRSCTVSGNTLRGDNSTDTDKSPIFSTGAVGCEIASNTIDASSFGAALSTNGRGVISSVGDTGMRIHDNDVSGFANGYGIAMRSATTEDVEKNYVHGNFNNRIGLFVSNTEVKLADNIDGGYTAAQLPTASWLSRGSRLVCTDCTHSNPCATGGSGALAVKADSTLECAGFSVPVTVDSSNKISFGVPNIVVLGTLGLQVAADTTVLFKLDQRAVTSDGIHIITRDSTSGNTFVIENTDHNTDQFHIRKDGQIASRAYAGNAGGALCLSDSTGSFGVCSTTVGAGGTCTCTPITTTTTSSSTTTTTSTSTTTSA